MSNTNKNHCLNCRKPSNGSKICSDCTTGWAGMVKFFLIVVPLLFVTAYFFPSLLSTSSKVTTQQETSPVMDDATRTRMIESLNALHTQSTTTSVEIPPEILRAIAPKSDTFHGFDCTQDCSGNVAGYRWAEKNSISDENDCRGNSSSFIKGCLVYVRENN